MPVDPRGSESRYVFSEIVIASNTARAKELGMDLDGDGGSDNSLGMLLSAIGSVADYNLSAEVNELVASGELLQLIDVRSTALGNSEEVGVRVSLGVDQDEDPSDNLSGEEVFAVDPSVPGGQMSGHIVDDQLVVELGTAPLAVTFPGLGSRFVFNLESARLEARITNEGLQGQIGGVISQAEIDQDLLPALAEGFARSIARDCPEEVCADSSFGELLVRYFDQDQNYRVTVDELRDNNLTQALLRPDLDIFDANGDNSPDCDGINESLSFAVGFTAVRASMAR